MRRALVVTSLLVLTVLTAPPASAATVSVGEYFFSPNPLKVAEGVGEFLFASISREARTSLTGKLGGALLKPKLRPREIFPSTTT